MGFQLEVVSGRTITIRGVKKVIRVVQRQNATTHSYTVYITLNASGMIPNKLPVVLYEPTGVPQHFERDMQKLNNLHAYWIAPDLHRVGWARK